MRYVRAIKVILYPIAGVFQFVVLPIAPALILCIALIGLACVNLRAMIAEARKEQP